MQPEAISVTLRLNGQTRTFPVGPEETLLHLIRTKAGLTGTKCGCGMGECGACTVLLDGRAVNSCCVLAIQADGCSVETIEGIGSPERPYPLQTAFLQAGAIQCGFCTPGMILAAKALLDTNPHPTRNEIRLALSGNLCRCTGYEKIFTAVEQAAEILARQKEGSPV